MVFVFVFVLAHEQAISTCISQEGEFVDCSDECGEVVLVVGCVDEVFESVEFGWVDLSVPLQFVLALLNHGPQVRTLVHPTGERLLEAGSSNLQRVGAEADQVEVPGGGDKTTQLEEGHRQFRIPWTTVYRGCSR